MASSVPVQFKPQWKTGKCALIDVEHYQQSALVTTWMFLVSLYVCVLKCSGITRNAWFTTLWGIKNTPKFFFVITSTILDRF